MTGKILVKSSQKTLIKNSSFENITSKLVQGSLNGLESCEEEKTKKKQNSIKTNKRSREREMGNKEQMKQRENKYQNDRLKTCQQSH